MKYVKLTIASLLLMALLAISIVYFGHFLAPLDWKLSNLVFKNNLKNTLCMVAAGAALGIAGFIIQALFRNELATPSTIGITPIATLAIILASLVGISTIYQVLFAIMLALVLTLLFFWWIFKTQRSISNIVIIGLIISGLIVGLNSLLATAFNLPVYIASILNNNHLTVSWNTVYFLTPLIVCGIALLLFLAKRIQIIEKGQGVAQNVGVNHKIIVPLALALVVIITVAAVMLYGMITFLSLAAPLLVRYVLHTQNVWLDMSLAILLTISFLLAGDILVRYKSYLMVSIIPISISVLLISGKLLWK